MKRGREKIVIGTRGSELALWQANRVAEGLDRPSEIRVIRTSGDRFLDKSLQGRIEKGFFTKEIEESLLEGEIDIAVHSLKDLPIEFHPRLRIGAHLERAAVSDLLLVHPDRHGGEGELPIIAGSRVGATSLRRQALLKLFSPESEAALLRGNVPTRIRKCREGEYGAIIVARAGVDRLEPDLGDLIGYELNPEIWLPAPGQGVIAAEVRADDIDTLTSLAEIDHSATGLAVDIERKLLANFEGGCHTAFGAWARPREDRWEVTVGLEQPETGWVETTFIDRLENCMKRGPDTFTRFSVPEVGGEKSLFRRYIPSP